MIDPALLEQTARIARDFLAGLPDRPVGPPVDLDDLRAALDIRLGEEGVPAAIVIAELARAADAGLVASAGPRYFGFVTGGSLPAAMAADWLTSAWDQNAGLAACSSAAGVVEEVAGAWVVELLGLPASASVGFVTGAQMANFTGLAVARDAVLRRAGWDAARDGLAGGPRVDVVVGERVHVTVRGALRMLGLGFDAARVVPADEQGRMRADALREALRESRGPAIVCAQAGEVNTGAFDPLEEIAAATAEHGAWLHVDGAFGLWAAASPARRGLVAGVERADSWATDGHKWLNVPYDSGLAIVRDAEAHRAAMRLSASYLARSDGVREGHEYVPEASRRARGLPIYAALRSLGRRGVAELVDRCCDLAARMAERLAAEPGVIVLNDVVLNQVLVRFEGDSPAEGDALTRAVVARVQAGGTCWLGGTVWRDREAIRIAVSNWSTTAADADRSVDAILAAAREERAATVARS